MDERVPLLRQVVLDTTDARSLAEFYRQLLGLRYRPGDEPPSGSPDVRGQDWLVLRNAVGMPQLDDRSGDPEEQLRVYADPAGHPFCVFVAPDPADR